MITDAYVRDSRSNFEDLSRAFVTQDARQWSSAGRAIHDRQVRVANASSTNADSDQARPDLVHLDVLDNLDLFLPGLAKERRPHRTPPEIAKIPNSLSWPVVDVPLATNEVQMILVTGAPWAWLFM
jgi:hypothetical protein